MRIIVPLIILVITYACKKDYGVREGIGRVSVCKITNPKKDLLWIDEKIENHFKRYKSLNYKYISATFGIFPKNILAKDEMQYFNAGGFFQSRDEEQIILFSLLSSQNQKFEDGSIWMFDCEGNFLVEGGIQNIYFGLKNEVTLKSQIEL